MGSRFAFGARDNKDECRSLGSDHGAVRCLEITV